MLTQNEAFCTSLDKVATAIQTGKYHSASKMATDFIHLAYCLRSKHEVFIGEALESICFQLHNTIFHHQVPESILINLNDTISKHMNLLVGAYNKQQEICVILQDMRYDATCFQFDIEQKSDSLPRQPIEVMPVRHEQFTTKNRNGLKQSQEISKFSAPRHTIYGRNGASAQSVDEQLDLLVDAVLQLHRDLQTLTSTVNHLVESNRSLEDAINANANCDSVPDNYDMPHDQIENLLSKHAVGKEFYPSDFAFEHGLNYESVLEVIEKLRARGKVSDIE